jgi:hypothetical protein
VTSHGWFSRFKPRASCHNLKVGDEAASADTKLKKKIVIRRKKSLTSMKLGCSGRRCQIEHTFRKRKRLRGFKAAKNRPTLSRGANVAVDCKLKPLLVYH